jgi:membrane fusion protein (multidrug efflux system)
MICMSIQSFSQSQKLLLTTRPEENSMLKITFSETPAEEKWILHGRLIHPWVQEFRACWRKNHRADVRRACVVDLNEVTFIDKSGERFLRLLARNGAQFTASGIYTKHVLEQLNVRRKRGYSTLLGFLIVLVFVTALGTGCERPVASAAAPAPPVVEVTPVIQKDEPLEGEWVGTLEGYVNAQIQPHVSGYLIRQDYQEGGFVRQGQVLFEIDPRPFQAALDQAKGQLAQAEAQMANAELNVKRDVPEAEAHAIPQSQLDNDTQALRGAQAAVEANQAAVEQASLNLGYTKVLSLIDGIAGINTVQVGNLVGPSTVLTAVSQVSPIKVYFPISEQEYLRMADGGAPGTVDWLTHASRIPLQLILADGTTYLYPGRIVFADRQVNTQTGTIQIVGEFPNPKNLLRPGQYARIRALTGYLPKASLVPQAAVNQQQGTYQVTVVGADNHAQLRTVVVGPRVGTLWVITSGLKPGERVVAVGAEKTKEGELVNPTPYKETEER